MRPHFSSVGTVICNVGGVKFQPFLKHSKHWKQALKCFKREAGTFLCFVSSFLTTALT